MATTSMGFSCARPCRALSVLASTLLLVAAFLCSCCAALKPQQLRGYGVSDRGFISAVERPDDKSIEQHLGTQRASQDFVKAYLVSLTYSVHSTKVRMASVSKCSIQKWPLDTPGQAHVNLLLLRFLTHSLLSRDAFQHAAALLWLCAFADDLGAG